jgi:hypothetical protein
MTCTGSFGKAKGQRLLVAHRLRCQAFNHPSAMLVQLAPSLDHLVGAGEQCGRHVEAERLCGLEMIVNSYLVGACTGSSPGFSPLRISIDVVGGVPELVGDIWSVGHQTTGRDNSCSRSRGACARDSIIALAASPPARFPIRSGRHCRSA